MSKTATSNKVADRRASEKKRPAAGNGKDLAERNGAVACSAKPAKAAVTAALVKAPSMTKLPAVAAKSVRRIGRRMATAVPSPGAAARDFLLRARSAGREALEAGTRRLPIQRSIDVAVPLEVAWDAWMELAGLPEGAHRVQGIARRNGRLVGRVTGAGRSADWEAEIVDEREGESFAWCSVDGSECAGLVTFHRLDDRLTRVELNLDVRPRGVTEAVALGLRLADRRAEADLRRFKARVQALDPAGYRTGTREGTRG